MISQLRNTIAHFTAEERQRTVSDSGVTYSGEEGEGAEQEVEEIPLRPHEQKLINYLVNDYLVRKVAPTFIISMSCENSISPFLS